MSKGHRDRRHARQMKKQEERQLRARQRELKTLARHLGKRAKGVEFVRGRP